MVNHLSHRSPDSRITVDPECGYLRINIACFRLDLFRRFRDLHAVEDDHDPRVLPEAVDERFSMLEALLSLHDIPLDMVERHGCTILVISYHVESTREAAERALSTMDADIGRAF